MLTATAIFDEPKIVGIEEYLEREERSKEKHQFIQGKIIAMPGGSLKHNRIATNAMHAIETAIRQKNLPFLVSNSNTKIWVPEIASFYYPDAVVICEVPQFYKNRRDVILNPLLIVEVASPSTEDFDRGSKFLDYATLPSFKEYLILQQDQPRARLSNRVENDLWQLGTVAGLDKKIELKSIGVSILMTDVYFRTENL